MIILSSGAVGYSVIGVFRWIFPKCYSFKEWCKKRLQKSKKPTVVKPDDVNISLHCVILSRVIPQIHSSRINGKCWHWWHDIGLRAAWLPVGLSVANLDAMLA